MSFLLRYAASCAAIIVCAVCLGSLSAEAQEADSNKRFRFGAQFLGSANIHAASFGALAGFPSCCPQYSSGSGIAPIVGIFAEIPLSSRVSHILRASLSDLSGDLSSVETSTTIVNNKITAARIQHSVSSNIKGISLEPDVHFKLTQAVGVYLGLRFDFSLKGEISQKEELIQPEVGTFENGRRIRNEEVGRIFALQPILASAVGGLRWELPMNRDASILLIPELALGFELNTITSSEQWRVHTIRLGAGIAFQSPRPDASFSNPVDNTPLVAELSAIPFDGQRELFGQSIRIEESEHIDVQSLAPFIFFESGSDALPARYASLTEHSIDSFEVQQAVRSTALASYYSILPIVGKRLRQHSSDSIVIRATIDNTEARSAELAKRRADNVSRYFQRIWGIDRLRIRTEVTTAETLFTESDPKARADQNRRVELHASSLILAPLQYRDTTHSIFPRYIRLRPLTRGGEAVDRWDIQLSQRGNILKSFNGNGNVPFKLTADLQESSIQLRNDSISCLMLVDGRRGGASSSALRVPTELLSLARKREEGINDTITVHTQLLCVDHSLLDSSRTQQATIMKALASRVSTWDYADYSQGPNALKLLSAQGIMGAKPRVNNPSSAPYSNTFPESRLYNRCIDLSLQSQH